MSYATIKEGPFATIEDAQRFADAEVSGNYSIEYVDGPQWLVDHIGKGWMVIVDCPDID
jgi:hypothetical protein